MNYDLLFRIAEKARGRGKLTPEERRFISVTVPAELADFPTVEYPKKVVHPGGFTISGAVVRTFSRCALVIAGNAALGRRYGGKSAFYDRVEEQLALGIALANFRQGHPKGAFCCPPCTLAVYPVLQAGLIRWFDSRALAPSVRELIEKRGWRFARFKNPRMIAWSLGPGAK